MHSFRDSKNRIWNISITVGAVKRVKSILGVDLLDAQKTLRDVFETYDLVKLIDIIFILIEDQAKTANVTDEDFGASLAGDSLQDAIDKFQMEYIDFFPNPRRTRSRTDLFLVL